MPRRGTFTGRTTVVFAVDPVELVELDPTGVPVVFSVDLTGVAVAFGRLLLGLAAEPDVAGFSFGREVRNAPRTSSPSCGGTATANAAHMKINPKRIAVNRITRSPPSESPHTGLIVLNTDVKDDRIAGLVRRHFDAHGRCALGRIVMFGKRRFFRVFGGKGFQFGLLRGG